LSASAVRTYILFFSLPSSPLHPSPAYPQIHSCVRNDVRAHPEAGTCGFAGRLRHTGDWGPGHQPMAPLACVFLLSSGEPGPPATHIVCSGRGHQPSLSTPRPIIPSFVSLDSPLTRLPPLTASYLHQ
jgi:hypothetical protein